MITQFRCVKCGFLFVQSVETGCYACCPKCKAGDDYYDNRNVVIYDYNMTELFSDIKED